MEEFGHKKIECFCLDGRRGAGKAPLSSFLFDLPLEIFPYDLNSRLQLFCSEENCISL